MRTAMALVWSLMSMPAALGQNAPADEPANQWVMRNPDGPNMIWENDIAYDPATHLIVWYGGHAWGYPQSNYTHLYDLTTNKWRDAQPAYRPQRRCLVMLNYLDSAGKMACSQGSSGHGSIPEGGFSGEYKKVFKSDPRGPWLYDVKADRWEHCRVLPPIWKREAHAQCAYDSSTDALVWLTGDKLGLYCPRTNRIAYRSLPKELTGRLAYGIAADPAQGKIVLFGGTGPGGWIWVKGDQAEAYAKYVHNDTWLYDVTADQWKQAQPKTVPPRGAPLFDHRFIPMVYHHPSGTVLMQQTPLDKYEPDTAKWPATQLWSFDIAKEEWTLVPTEKAPPYQGLLAYARVEDLLVLVGGGRDGPVKDDAGRDIFRPSLSKQLWTCRVQVPGRDPPAREVAVRGSFAISQAKPDEVELTIPPIAANSAPGAKALGCRVYRAEAKPFPGTFAAVDDAAHGGKLTLTVEPGKVYAFRFVIEGRSEPVGPVLFNQPWRPSGLVASVESDKKVVLRWDAPQDAELAGYRVYRATGAEIEKGAGQLLTEKPLAEGLFTDDRVDLSDGVVRSYWVTAVNRGGVESGASPLAYTFPDPPTALTAKLSADGKSIAVRWDWPKDVKLAGFKVYQVNNHINTHEMAAEKVSAWYASWKPITEGLVTEHEAAFNLPADDKARHHYFYLRAVNALGQEGFYTDIVSATDRRFHP